jgi:hypothetical protein
MAGEAKELNARAALPAFEVDGSENQTDISTRAWAPALSLARIIHVS